MADLKHRGRRRNGFCIKYLSPLESVQLRTHSRPIVRAFSTREEFISSGARRDLTSCVYFYFLSGFLFLLLCVLPPLPLVYSLCSPTALRSGVLWEDCN